LSGETGVNVTVGGKGGLVLVTVGVVVLVGLVVRVGVLVPFWVGFLVGGAVVVVCVGDGGGGGGGGGGCVQKAR